MRLSYGHVFGVGLIAVGTAIDVKLDTPSFDFANPSWWLPVITMTIGAYLLLITRIGR